jgi:hypothetical protein
MPGRADSQPLSLTAAPPPPDSICRTRHRHIYPVDGASNDHQETRAAISDNHRRGAFQIDLYAATLVLSAARPVDICNMDADTPDHVLKPCEIRRNVAMDILHQRFRYGHTVLPHFDMHGIALSCFECA